MIIKKLFLLFLIPFFFTTLSYSQPLEYHSPPLNIEEVDGSPSTFPWKLVFPSGSLTDNATGTTVNFIPTGPLDDEYVNIAGDTMTGDLDITRAVDGATGVDLEMYHNSASPADEDVIFKQTFYGNDSGDNKTEYGNFAVRVSSVTDTEEEAKIEWSAANDGSIPTDPLQMRSSGFRRLDDNTITDASIPLTLEGQWEVATTGSTNIDALGVATLFDNTANLTVVDGTISSPLEGMRVGYTIEDTISGTGSNSGSWTGLKVDVTDTDWSGTGTELLLDLQHDSVSELSVSSTGALTFGTTTTAGGSEVVYGDTSGNIAYERDAANNYDVKIGNPSLASQPELFVYDDINMIGPANNSGALVLQDNDSSTLLLQKMDTGEADIINNEGEIHIKPSGDLTDYGVFSTVADIFTIGSNDDSDAIQIGTDLTTITGDLTISKAAGVLTFSGGTSATITTSATHNTITIDKPILHYDNDGDSPGDNWRNQQGNTFTLRKDNSNYTFFYDDADGYLIGANGDTDDFLTINIISNNPTIGTSGADDLHLSSAGGDIVAEDDMTIAEASPHLTFRDTGTDNAYQIHFDGAAAQEPWRGLSFWRGTDTTGDSFTVGPNKPIMLFDEDNVVTFPEQGIWDDFGITIDGSGSAITTGSKGFRRLPWDCKVVGWTVLADQSGSVGVDIKHSTYENFPTTTSIVGSEKPNLSAAQKNRDVNLTTWTKTELKRNDVIEFNVDSASTVQRVHVFIHVNRS